MTALADEVVARTSTPAERPRGRARGRGAMAPMRLSLEGLTEDERKAVTAFVRSIRKTRGITAGAR